MADFWIFCGICLCLTALTECQQQNVKTNNSTSEEPYSPGISQPVPIDLGDPGTEKIKMSITSPGFNLDNNNSNNTKQPEEELIVFHDRMGELNLSPSEQSSSHPGHDLSQSDRMGEVGTGVAVKPQVPKSPECEKHIIQGYEKQIALFRDINNMSFYTSEQELEALCQELKPVQSGLKKFNENCVPNDLNFNQFFGGFEIIFLNLCNPNTYRNQFLKESPCINQTYTSVINTTCKMQHNENMEPSTGDQFKLPCRNTINTLQCLKDAVSKTCGNSTGEFLECYILTALGEIFTSNCPVNSGNCKGKIPNQTAFKENNYEVLNTNNSITTTPSVTHEHGSSDHSSKEGNFATSIKSTSLFMLAISFYYFAVLHIL